MSVRSWLEAVHNDAYPPKVKPECVKSSALVPRKSKIGDADCSVWTGRIVFDLNEIIFGEKEECGPNSFTNEVSLNVWKKKAILTCRKPNRLSLCTYQKFERFMARFSCLPAAICNFNFSIAFNSLFSEIKRKEKQQKKKHWLTDSHKYKHNMWKNIVVINIFFHLSCGDVRDKDELMLCGDVRNKKFNENNKKKKEKKRKISRALVSSLVFSLLKPASYALCKQWYVVLISGFKSLRCILCIETCLHLYLAVVMPLIIKHRETHCNVH